MGVSNKFLADWTKAMGKYVAHHFGCPIKDPLKCKTCMRLKTNETTQFQYYISADILKKL